MRMKRLLRGLAPGIAGVLLSGAVLAVNSETLKENFERRAAPSRPTVAKSTRPEVFIQDGHSQKPLLAHDAILKTDTKRKIASFVLPSVKEKKTVILPGSRAGLRIRAQKPHIHIDFPDANTSQFLLLRLRPRQNRREVSEIKTLAIRRDVEKKEEIVFANIRRNNDHQFTIIPAEPLTPGEYGLVKLPKLNPLDTKKVAVALVVWDFGVDRR